MAAFGADGRCLMRALQEELDDPDPQDCGRCSVCAGPRFAEPLDPVLVRAASLHLRSRPVILEVKKMAPDAEGRCRRSPTTCAPRRAVRWRGWATAAGTRSSQRGRRARALRRRAGRRGRRARAPLGRRAGARWVTAVPSDRSGPLVPDFARRLAAALGLPYADASSGPGSGPPQREMANARQQVANVRGAFAVPTPLPAGPCLLVDDLRFSGWTLAMLGRPAAPQGRPAGLPARAGDGVLGPSGLRRSPPNWVLAAATLAAHAGRGDRASP